MLEEQQVLGIGAWDARFDEIDAEVIESMRDIELVLKGERDVFALGAVAQR